MGVAEYAPLDLIKSGLCGHHESQIATLYALSQSSTLRAETNRLQWLAHLVLRTASRLQTQQSSRHDKIVRLAVKRLYGG